MLLPRRPRGEKVGMRALSFREGDARRPSHPPAPRRSDPFPPASRGEGEPRAQASFRPGLQPPHPHRRPGPTAPDVAPPLATKKKKINAPSASACTCIFSLPRPIISRRGGGGGGGGGGICTAEGMRVFGGGPPPPPPPVCVTPARHAVHAHTPAMGSPPRHLHLSPPPPPPQLGQRQP